MKPTIHIEFGMIVLEWPDRRVVHEYSLSGMARALGEIPIIEHHLPKGMGPGNFPAPKWPSAPKARKIVRRTEVHQPSSGLKADARAIIEKMKMKG